MITPFCMSSPGTFVVNLILLGRRYHQLSLRHSPPLLLLLASFDGINHLGYVPEKEREAKRTYIEVGKAKDV